MDCSDDMAALYGLDPAEADAGAPPTLYRRALHPDDRAHAAAALNAALQDRTYYQTIYRVISPEGGVHLIHASGRPSLTPLGFQIHGVALDISDGALADRLADAALQSAILARMVGDDLLRYMTAQVLVAAAQRMSPLN